MKSHLFLFFPKKYNILLYNKLKNEKPSILHSSYQKVTKP